MKQSAVEWFVEQIFKEKGLVDLDIQAAKEIEKSNLLRYGAKCFIHGLVVGLSSAIIGILISKFI